MEEIWKYIEGYPNYMVSNLGRVKSLNYRNTGKEKILSEVNDGQGYLKVHLRKPGSSKTIRIHRLVAQAFIPNPNNLPMVNHKDEEKTRNSVDNLEWCTAQYNLSYGTRQNREIKTQQQTHPNCKSVLQFSKTGEFIRKWKSMREVERELGFYGGSISSCCKGKLKSTGGYVWGYAEDYERIPFKVFDLEIYEKKKAA